jgi:hypothetical protein
MKVVLVPLGFLLASFSIATGAQQPPPAPSPADQAEDSSATTAAAQKVIQQLVSGEFSKTSAWPKRFLQENSPKAGRA